MRLGGDVGGMGEALADSMEGVAVYADGVMEESDDGGREDGREILAACMQSLFGGAVRSLVTQRMLRESAGIPGSCWLWRVASLMAGKAGRLTVGIEVQF